MEAVTGRVVLDEHVGRVVKFMERELPADRLAHVARVLPMIARVLWGPDSCGSLEYEPISAMQPAASECGLVGACAGDGSAVAAGGH